MNVQNLIDFLNTVEDKTLPIWLTTYDDDFEVGGCCDKAREYKDAQGHSLCVELAQAEA